MAKYGLAVTLHVLVEPDARAGLRQDHFKPGLAAFQRITPEIVAVEFDQVEGVQENAFIVVAVADAIEGCDAVVIAGNRFAVLGSQ